AVVPVPQRQRGSAHVGIRLEHLLRAVAEALPLTGSERVDEKQRDGSNGEAEYAPNRLSRPTQPIRRRASAVGQLIHPDVSSPSIAEERSPRSRDVVVYRERSANDAATEVEPHEERRLESNVGLLDQRSSRRPCVGEMRPVTGEVAPLPVDADREVIGRL